MGDILKRGGLVRPPAAAAADRARRGGDACARANEEWAIDFKGWFRTRDGRRCDPLTITDSASRYLVEVRIVAPTLAGVKAACERAFAEFGLPSAIRSDNGAPFGSTGAGGLSELSVWWLRLGIEPRYIPPSRPQDNGRHERMHRTLKAETSKPAAATAAEQQERFESFGRTTTRSDRTRRWARRRRLGAGGRRPALCSGAPGGPWYDADHEVRRVRAAGQIKWGGEQMFVGEAWPGSWSASPSWRAAAISCASAVAILG